MLIVIFILQCSLANRRSKGLPNVFTLSSVRGRCHSGSNRILHLLGTLLILHCFIPRRVFNSFFPRKYLVVEWNSEILKQALHSSSTPGFHPPPWPSKCLQGIHSTEVTHSETIAWSKYWNILLTEQSSWRRRVVLLIALKLGLFRPVVGRSTPK